MTIDVFICSRKEKTYCSAGCGRRAEKLCSFALGGKLIGETCNIPLCARCATGKKPMCPPHARLTNTK